MTITGNMSLAEKSIFDRYKQKFPFQVVAFANELGIKVFVDQMPDNQSGAISKDSEGYSIYVNSDHSETRVRFTLAHELGHYFNDKAYLEENKSIVDTSKQAGKKFLFRKNCIPDDPAMRKMDIRANQFAADLLMPKDKFTEIWREKISPKEVSVFFNVSIEAVKTRAAVLLGEIF